MQLRSPPCATWSRPVDVSQWLRRKRLWIKRVLSAAVFFLFCHKRSWSCQGLRGSWTGQEEPARGLAAAEEAEATVATWEWPEAARAGQGVASCCQGDSSKGLRHASWGRPARCMKNAWVLLSSEAAAQAVRRPEQFLEKRRATRLQWELSFNKLR